MKFSETWLRQLINTDLSITTISDKLSMAGLEVSNIKPLPKLFTGVVIGEVLSVASHPNAERLAVCTVRAASVLTIVCGANNVRVGLKVAVALVGAELPGNVHIKVVKLRGVESSGMLCSAAELGLPATGPGIFELPEDAPVGVDLAAYWQLDDCILEVDFTPNRGDCLSVLGLAREIAALYDLQVTLPSITPVPAKASYPITLTAPCPHYGASILQGIDVTKPSPQWLINCLEHSGLHSINPVVDVTNYVMLELGQPLHAFDANFLTTGIKVRFATEGETLTLLDGKKLQLTTTDLVIADATIPLALAGIMGGLNSGVTETTTSILLESAFFIPEVISQSAKRYNLQTEASYRFERGVDPQLQMLALYRAINLLQSIVGGEVTMLQELKELPTAAPIFLPRKSIAQILGIELSDAVVIDILQRFQMQVTPATDGWQVLAPSYRFDIKIAEDLVEELARGYGYNQIPEQELCVKLAPVVKTYDRQRLLTMVTSIGYHEIITYSFVDPQLLLKLAPAKPILLLNPIAPNLAGLRTTLWAGLLQTVLNNLRRQQTRVRLFECGVCFYNEQELQQPLHLAGVVVGSHLPEQWGTIKRDVDFFDLKNDVTNILAFLGYQHGISYRSETHLALHPACRANIYYQDGCIGSMGQLHPHLTRALALPLATFVFELNLTLLGADFKVKFNNYAKYPLVVRDIALLIPKNVTWEAIRTKILAASNNLLHNVEVFDIYCGAKVGLEVKSIAIRLVFQHMARTLQDEEVELVVAKIIAMLERHFNAKLRG